MKTKKDKQFLTVLDAATHLGISVSTLRRYTRRKLFPRPKREFFGTQSVAIYTLEDIEKLKKKLDELRGDGRG